jgi:EAL domain-containing protein (putative c-di-GMP-specific phosphodiesterase class I)
MAVADKILRDMSEFPLVSAGHSFSANCSLGVAMVDGASPLSPEALISQADVACRQAKSQGRNRACRYEPDEKHIETIKNDVQWQNKLKRALKEDGLLLHYQPIERVSDGTVRHYEVLVRLDEDGVLYRPDQFLPAAVRFGLMRDVDRWVIEAAIEELAQVRTREGDISFAINLGGSAFTDGLLAEFVLERLEACGVPAEAVVFEITEQVAVGSFSEAVPQIQALMEAGCTFAVDDFGTGYSSLSYLKRLPVQYIKIDGSFIQRMSESPVDQTIVRAIADIARIMGKETIAEFVGDEETKALIGEIGIDYAQGYLIGAPKAEISGGSLGKNVVSIAGKRQAT